MTTSPPSSASDECRGTRPAVGIVLYYTSIQYQINQILSRNAPLIHSPVGMKCYNIIIPQDLLLDLVYQHSTATSYLIITETFHTI